jgi:3,4-dihydroxy 2-butanone 4-phosphate synthase / GTP cyclohydrolase II
MSNFDKIEDAVIAIKNGEMIVVLDDEDRENEGDLIMAAEMVTSEAINFMATEGRGLICAPVNEDIAQRLELNSMVAENTEFTKCNFTVSVDYKHDTTTGISASDRAKTIKAIADFHALSSDFARPGHIFPIIARTGGVLVRAGHTEASVDLARLAGLTPAGVLCEITREDGEMMRKDELMDFAKKHDLRIITIKDLIEYRRKTEKLVRVVAETVLPTQYGEFQMRIYKNSVDENEHIVLKLGEWAEDEAVLVRAHSECITGEVFNSLKCDCGLQLDRAMEMIAGEGKGVLLYLRQEGRGIGLVNKVKAYKLQEEGMDTVEANEELGFPPDLRQYGIGAQILADVGVRKMHLLTNNPTKVVGLEGYGLELVDRIALEVDAHERSKVYLKAKKEKMGHILKNI